MYASTQHSGQTRYAALAKPIHGRPSCIRVFSWHGHGQLSICGGGGGAVESLSLSAVVVVVGWFCDGVLGGGGGGGGGVLLSVGDGVEGCVDIAFVR